MSDWIFVAGPHAQYVDITYVLMLTLGRKEDSEKRLRECCDEHVRWLESQ